MRFKFTYSQEREGEKERVVRMITGRKAGQASGLEDFLEPVELVEGISTGKNVTNSKLILDLG